MNILTASTPPLNRNDPVFLKKDKIHRTEIAKVIFRKSFQKTSISHTSNYLGAGERGGWGSDIGFQIFAKKSQKKKNLFFLIFFRASIIG